MCPVHPLAGEILIDQITQSLAVVGKNLGRLVSHAGQQFRQSFLKGISPPGQKLLIKTGSPICLVYLVAVVEESVRIGNAATFERFLEALDVMSHGYRIEMVNHQTFPARSRPFDI